jgi:pilus assembly protein CpaE
MQAVITCDKLEERGPYRQLLLNCGIECGADDVVLYGDLLPRLNRGGAELLIVALGSNPEETLRLVRQANQSYPLPILILGPSHDAQLILNAMQAGAREYLDLEMGRLRERLASALEKLRKAGAIQFRRGQSVVVTGAVPGSGVTTVASGLAFALAALHPKQVLLAELDARVPELALNLDLQPRNTIAQLLADWQRVDASAVRQAALEHPAGVYVLADAMAKDPPAPVEADACKQLMSLVRTMYDYAVYDAGHAAQTALAQQALRGADRVVIVVRLDVPSLRLTRSLLVRLADLGLPKESLTLVGNRYGQRQQLDWKKAEEALGVPMNVWLPDDPATVNQALNLGQPLLQVSSWAKINRRLGELAQHLNGTIKR